MWQLVSEITAQADGGTDITSLVQAVGIPVAVLIVVLFLIIRGFLRTKQELDALQQKCDDATKQRDWYRDRLDRVLILQEENTSVVKEAVQKRAEIGDLEDLARLVDQARDQGLLPKG